jgi:cell division protein FtsB
MRGTDVGLLAQDVEKVLPEAVAAAPFDKDYKTIKMNQQLIALLVESVRELKQEVDSLKQEVDYLKSKGN